MLLGNKFILVSIAVTVASLTISNVANAEPNSKTTSTAALTTTVPSTGGSGFGGGFSDSVPEQPWWQISPPKPSPSAPRRVKAPPKPSPSAPRKGKALPKPQPVHLSWVLSGDILFNSGSATLSVAAESQLAGVVAQAQLHLGCRIAITGYTDSVPYSRPGGNAGLSLARAKAVARYFATTGLSADTITTRGDGSADPVGNNSTTQGRQLNRRVDISLTCG